MTALWRTLMGQQHDHVRSIFPEAAAWLASRTEMLVKLPRKIGSSASPGGRRGGGGGRVAVMCMYGKHSKILRE